MPMSNSHADVSIDGDPTIEIPPLPKRPSRARAVMILLVVLVLLISASIAAVKESMSVVNWTTVFVEDFDDDVPIGGFPGSAYENSWMSYDGFRDTSGVGVYEPSKVLSVHDGTLDMYLHTEDGQPLGAAPIPLVNGQWGGQVYGRYVVRFRADSLPGFGAGWLLWPDSNDWGEGEIDFPEGNLDGTILLNQHCRGDFDRKCLAVDTEVPFNSGWHTTIIEWTPDGVRFLLDGQELAYGAESPTTPFHLVLQTATNGDVPHPGVAGHVLIDHVSIATWK